VVLRRSLDHHTEEREGKTLGSVQSRKKTGEGGLLSGRGGGKFPLLSTEGS